MVNRRVDQSQWIVAPRTLRAMDAPHGISLSVGEPALCTPHELFGLDHAMSVSTRGRQRHSGISCLSIERFLEQQFGKGLVGWLMDAYRAFDVIGANGDVTA
jgi:hypothetical protein